MSNDLSTPATATAIVDASGEQITSDSIPEIDLRNFTQPALLALSLSSSLALPHTEDDIISPKIDRSVFNESAGGRKQTYNRLRLAKAGTTALPSSSSSSNGRRRGNQEEDNSRIVAVFNQLFNASENADALVPFDVKYDGAVHSYCDNVTSLEVPVPVEGSGVGGKRKRGRPRKNVGNELVNISGGAADLEGLSRLEDPFGDELRRRTRGLESDGELLRFLAGLIGDWVDWRMNAKFIDARKFGEVLPQGWKIMVGLEHRGNHSSLLTCQQYISPGGRHFLSCKDAFAYLLSSNGHRDTQAVCEETSHHGENESSKTNQKLGNVLGSKELRSGLIEQLQCISMTKQTSSHLEQSKSSQNPGM